MPEILKKATKENLNVYRASFSYNDGDPIEEFLGNSSINYEDENITIYTEG